MRHDTTESDLRAWVAALCTPDCAGRRTGTEGARAARAFLVDTLTSRGLVPRIQPVPACDGENVLAEVRAEGGADRWVIVAAHYDHLGAHDHGTYWGADDNAAAVAIALHVAARLAKSPPRGRHVLFAWFDAEEPPHFDSDSMGSMHFTQQPDMPLSSVDLMVCMDLVGHSFGPSVLPPEVTQSLFVLGAERSQGTSDLVRPLERAVPGVIARRADAQIIPPLSDHYAFWRARVPFLFLTCGRWQHYHMPTDTPEKLDYPKMAATVDWLEALTRVACERPEPRVEFTDRRHDISTLDTLAQVLALLMPYSEMADFAARQVEVLRAACDEEGRLPESMARQVPFLISQLEEALA